jgi:hypothetical protein
MFSWIFGGGTTKPGGVLVLQPDIQAKILPGFTSGNPLRLQGNPGDTVGTLLDRFNIYRGPDAQIVNVWSLDGKQIIPPATPVEDTLIVLVKL